MGRSGSGKGTQASLLMNLLKKIDPGHPSMSIETGKELRNFIKEPNYTAQVTKTGMEKGELMPEFMPIYLWGKLFVSEYTGNEYLFFDGTPRRLMEAKVLDSVFPFFKLAKPSVIYLDVEHEESVKRLVSRGRELDGHAEIEKRRGWFEVDVKPTIEYYRTNPNVNFLDIDGERSIEEIHADIVKRLGLA